MKPASYWIDHLQLLQHPEGGFYKETYRAADAIAAGMLPKGFSGDRNFSTAIYFLLHSHDRSAFHRIKSDELWFHHAGSSLTLYVLSRAGLSTHKLGQHIDKGESLQVIIPANCWFGALVNEPESYVLSSCTVSPGFDFADFELGGRADLLYEFPEYADIIQQLT